MKRSARFTALVVALSAILTVPIAAAAATDQVLVCHRTSGNAQDGRGWVQIRVSESSVGKHLAHGDALPTEPVPGSEGASVFDAECNPGPAATLPPEPPPSGEPPSQSDVVFAVAFSDINENGEYDEGDVLIAKLIDGVDDAADGTIGPGDRVITAEYPKDFAMSEFGTFLTNEHIVSVTNALTGYSCNVSSGDATFVFSSGNGDFDLYSEWSGTDITKVYDKRSSAAMGSDEVRADLASPSDPLDGVASVLGSSDPANHAFIEVQANCQP